VTRRGRSAPPTPTSTCWSRTISALADLVVERYREALAGDIRMNCDTCAYRVLLPGFEDKLGAPQTPHHHPEDPAHGHGRGHGHGHGHAHA
jgi:sirohydrochlorin cobaltochelatase